VVWNEVLPRLQHLLVVKRQREHLPSTYNRHDIFLTIQLKLRVDTKVVLQRQRRLVRQTSSYRSKWRPTDRYLTFLTQAQMKAVWKHPDIIRLIIGSDQRSETKQGKIVRFRSCQRHFRFIISCRRHFVWFILNFIHVIPKKGVIWCL